MSGDKPFFSVVIPLYNKQNYVQETIKSVLEQSFQDFEIVVVNDGSTDKSATVVESIEDKRIRLIHQENAGVSVARNRGIKEAKADYIAFLDADDIWLPEFLQTMHDMIIDFPNAGMYATGFKHVDNLGNQKPIEIKGLPSNEYVGIIPNYFKSIFLGINPTCSSALCIPRKIFFENNIWFPAGEKYGEDAHVWIRIAMIYDIAYTTEVCASYNIETENNTINEAYKVKKPHNSIVSLWNYSYLIQNKEKLKYFNLYMNKRMYRFIFLNIKNNDKSSAFKNFFKYKLSIKYRLILICLFLIPSKFFPLLKTLYKSNKNFQQRIKK